MTYNDGNLVSKVSKGVEFLALLIDHIIVNFISNDWQSELAGNLDDLQLVLLRED